MSLNKCQSPFRTNTRCDFTVYRWRNLEYWLSFIFTLSPSDTIIIYSKHYLSSLLITKYSYVIYYLSIKHVPYLVDINLYPLNIHHYLFLMFNITLNFSTITLTDNQYNVNCPPYYIKYRQLYLAVHIFTHNSFNNTILNSNT